MVILSLLHDQWRIWDFPEVRASTLQGCGVPNFPKNCMKLKEFGPGGGSMRSLCPLRSATDDGHFELDLLLTTYTNHSVSGDNYGI